MVSGIHSAYLLLMLWLVAAAADAGGVTSAEERRSLSKAELTPVLVHLQINGHSIDSTVIVLRSSDLQWYLPGDSIRRARIRLPEITPVRFNEVNFFPVDAIGVRYSNFDTASQTLSIQFDTNAFEMTYLGPKASIAPNSFDPASGFFINYDLLIENIPSGIRQRAFADFVTAAGPGVLSSTHAYLGSDQTDAHLRLDTTYTIDRLDQRASWRFGDTISRSGSMMGRPVRFGGLQYSTNFLTQPGLVLTPMTTLGGQAALPSTVDLYVNNVLQNSHQVPPGPFSVSTAPLVVGDGEVTLRIRDIAGREEIISQRFYASTALLSPGLSDFSFESGFLRRNFGQQSNDYGDFFGSASYRTGLTPQLTVDGNIQAQQGGLKLISGGLATAVPGLGTLSAALAISDDGRDRGLQSLLSIERRQGRHSLALRSQQASESFRHIGVDDNRQALRTDTLFWCYKLDKLGSINVSYLSQQTRSQGTTDIYSASFSTIRHTWGTFVVSAMQSRSETKQNSLYLIWVLPLEREASASITHLQGQNRQEQTVFQMNKTLPAGDGIGYRLQTAINASQQIAIFAQNRFGQVRAEAASLDEQTSARIGVSGALARLDRQWFLTRRIGSSYGLVRMPGLSRVRVYVDNQYAGETDDKGYAFLPRLHPYIRNQVSIDPIDLPMDTTIDTLTVRPVPAWRSGVIIDFPVRRESAATLTLVLSDGTPIPAGARIRLSPNSTDFAVGHDGLAFISGLKKMNEIEVYWRDQRCLAMVPYSDADGMVPYLGEFSCEMVSFPARK